MSHTMADYESVVLLEKVKPSIDMNHCRVFSFVAHLSCCMRLSLSLLSSFDWCFLVLSIARPQLNHRYISRRRSTKKRQYHCRTLSHRRHLLRCCSPRSVRVFVHREVRIMSSNRLPAIIPDRSVARTPQYEQGAKVVILVVPLVWNVIESIIAWWNGEIDGWECISDITGAIISTMTTAIGAYCGFTLGTSIFPGAGAIIGTSVGAPIGARVGNTLADWLRCKIFGLEKSKALGNAYRHLGLKPDCSNQVLNSRYRELCLQHHPDKGGDAVEFCKVQVAFELIEAARE